MTWVGHVCHYDEWQPPRRPWKRRNNGIVRKVAAVDVAVLHAASVWAEVPECPSAGSHLGKQATNAQVEQETPYMTSSQATMNAMLHHCSLWEIMLCCCGGGLMITGFLLKSLSCSISSHQWQKNSACAWLFSLKRGCCNETALTKCEWTKWGMLCTQYFLLITKTIGVRQHYIKSKSSFTLPTDALTWRVLLNAVNPPILLLLLFYMQNNTKLLCLISNQLKMTKQSK